MKNMKKMAVFGALMAVANAGATEKVVKDFALGEIEALESFNSHLIVKSNGTIGSVKTPYMFVGTNTNDFAEKAFTFKEMENTTSIAFENNYVYTTRQGDTNHVYRFTVENNDTLNGLRSEMKVFDVDGDISGILAVKDGKIYTTSKDGSTLIVGAKQPNNSSVVVPDDLKDEVYGTANGVIYYFDSETHDVMKYKNGERTVIGYCGTLNSTNNKPVKIIAFDDDHVYILGKKEILYNKGNPITDYENVKGISVGEDSKSLIVTSENSESYKKVSSYNVEKEKSTEIFSEADDNLPKLFTSKKVTINKITYEGEGRKLSYSRE